MALAMLLFFIEVIFISGHANNKFSLLVDKDDLFSFSNQAITGWVHTQTAVFPSLFIPAYQLKKRKECLVGLDGGGEGGRGYFFPATQEDFTYLGYNLNMQALEGHLFVDH